MIAVIEELSVQECFVRLAQTWVEVEQDQETGNLVAHDMPAMLLELREAVFGGMESTGGSGGYKARMPISDGALDLYEAIDHEITEAWGTVFPNQIPNADIPEKLLAQLVAKSTDDTPVEITVAEQMVSDRGSRDERWWVERSPQMFTVAGLMRRWVKQISEFFNPPRTREIKAPCVSCGEEWAVKRSGGEERPYRVFVFVQDNHGNTLEARCHSCGMSWGLDKMLHLAAALGATVPDTEG